MNCSSLNEHLFRRNLVDSPNCVCGSVESTLHFLLHCPRYTNIRNEMLLSLANMPLIFDVNLFLFGSSDLSDDQNVQIFLQIQNFIIKSKRFIGT